MADTRSNDLWHWHINVDVEDAGDVANAVRDGRFNWVSPGAIEIPNKELGFESAVMVHDPDGHGVMLRNGN